jgi:hypothetical protein
MMLSEQAKQSHVEAFLNQHVRNLLSDNPDNEQKS